MNLIVFYDYIMIIFSFSHHFPLGVNDLLYILYIYIRLILKEPSLFTRHSKMSVLWYKGKKESVSWVKPCKNMTLCDSSLKQK